MSRKWITTTAAALGLAFVTGGAARAQSKARPSDEAGIALLGAQIVVARGMIHDPDAPRVEEGMRAAYEKMRADEDNEKSAAIYQSDPIASGVPDLLVYRPRSGKTPLAVIFLHGYGVRFALPCWQIANVAAARGAMTVCPSIGTDGDWWSPKGSQIVRETVSALHAAGYERIVLAGLSNGGIGATELAPRMSGAFVGLVLISGADPSARSTGLPVLVLQGQRDAMVAPSASRAYATKAHGEYVPLADGHFAMMLDQSVADAAIARFLSRF